MNPVDVAHRNAAERQRLMPAKLKTFQTSLGFFDLAIAAPSMKAALAAWGSEANLFHQGFAKQADDPAIIAATMAKPGIVLRRAVGSTAEFTEHAALPRSLRSGGADETGAAPKSSPTPPPEKPKDNAARHAAKSSAQEQMRHDRERRRQEAFQEAERKRRREAIAKAEAALDDAKRIHDTKINEIAAARAALDRQWKAEESRWNKQQAKLQARLERARE